MYVVESMYAFPTQTSKAASRNLITMPVGHVTQNVILGMSRDVMTRCAFGHVTNEEVLCIVLVT